MMKMKIRRVGSWLSAIFLIAGLLVLVSIAAPGFHTSKAYASSPVSWSSTPNCSTWVTATAPSGTTSATVTISGGGGGGGAASNDNGTQAGPGGGGGQITATVDLTAGTTVSVELGCGGAGGQIANGSVTSVPAANGGQGYANGGSGGPANSNAAISGGSSGGGGGGAASILCIGSGGCSTPLMLAGGGGGGGGQWNCYFGSISPGSGGSGQSGGSAGSSSGANGGSSSDANGGGGATSGGAGGGGTGNQGNGSGGASTPWSSPGGAGGNGNGSNSAGAGGGGGGGGYNGGGGGGGDYCFSGSDAGAGGGGGVSVVNTSYVSGESYGDAGNGGGASAPNSGSGGGNGSIILNWNSGQIGETFPPLAGCGSGFSNYIPIPVGTTSAGNTNQPPGPGLYPLQIWGAGGAAGDGGSNNNGGSGDQSFGEITIAGGAGTGQRLYANIGCGGQGTNSGNGGVGYTNGGNSGNSYYAGGGGGSSALCIGNTSGCQTVEIIAGGGGGGGEQGCDYFGSCNNGGGGASGGLGGSGGGTWGNNQTSAGGEYGGWGNGGGGGGGGSGGDTGYGGGGGGGGYGGNGGTGSGSTSGGSGGGVDTGGGGGGGGGSAGGSASTPAPSGSGGSGGNGGYQNTGSGNGGGGGGGGFAGGGGGGGGNSCTGFWCGSYDGAGGGGAGSDWVSSASIVNHADSGSTGSCSYNSYNSGQPGWGGNGQNDGCPGYLTQGVTFVGSVPATPTPTSATFTVGALGSVSFAASGGVGYAGGYWSGAIAAGTAPWSESGALPSGLSFNSSTGTISGTPVAGTGGVYTVTIAAANDYGTSQGDTFTITVHQAPQITSATTTTFTAGLSDNFSVTDAAGTYPAPTITDTAFSGCTPSTLPTGVLISSAGLISSSATLTNAGNYTICLVSSNGVGANSTQAFTLVVTWDNTTYSSSAQQNEVGDFYGVAYDGSNIVAVGDDSTGNYGQISYESGLTGADWNVVDVFNGVSDATDLFLTTGPLFGVSCPSALICVAVGENTSGGAQAIYTATSPLGSAAWLNSSLPSGVSELYSVTCPSTLVCYAVGSDSGVPVIIETSNAGVSWTLAGNSLPSGILDLYGITCVSTSVCLAVGTGENPPGSHTYLGVVIYSSNQSSSGGTWTTEAYTSTGELSGIACTGGSTDYCVATGVGGGAAEIYDANISVSLTTWDSGYSGASGSAYFYSVACSSAPACYAVGWAAGKGLIMKATALAPGSSVWTQVPDGTFSINGATSWWDISCPSSIVGCITVGTRPAPFYPVSAYGS